MSCDIHDAIISGSDERADKLKHQTIEEEECKQVHSFICSSLYSN